MHRTDTTATEALIVSHGQPGDPAPAEAETRDLAARVGRHLPGWSVTGATLAAPGALEGALAHCTAPPLVYPLFMTDGWFIRSVLPDRLHGRAARILPPLGLDPGLPPLAAAWLAGTAADRGWTVPGTRILVAGHGSGRSRNSARATREFAAAIATHHGWAEIRTGFIEEPPVLSEAARDMGAQALCLPFFAAARGHVLDDIPHALAAAGFTGPALPPIGLHPDVPALIARALDRAARAPAG